MLLDALMPFQLEGVRFGLQRGGRCLIADEMGLGKTLQVMMEVGKIFLYNLWSWYVAQFSSE